MGQVALGFRSLLIRLAVFFVMAVLLAWALGGTLWPRAETAELDTVTFDGREWFWRLSVGGREPGQVRWTMMCRGSDGEPQPLDGRTWTVVAQPLATPDALYYAGRGSFNPNEPWRIVRVAGDGVVTDFEMPDRLAVEQQLGRVKEGLLLQDQEEIRSQRPRVLDPGITVAQPRE